MKAAVIVFPGSNCDRDLFYALKYVGFETEYIFRKEPLDDFDLIGIPGGFSYGDYLRPGAVAAREEIGEEIKRQAVKGKPILGICNGFQILVEMNLLPGALLQNPSGKFSCKWIELEVTDNQTPFTLLYEKGEKIRLPIANGFGRYVKGDKEPRVVFRYTENINDSDDLIAGIASQDGNIVALMPHPERAYEEILGGTDGLKLFRSIKLFLEEKRGVKNP
ncbi:MAG: phosphoribosylformylglycinamidine synthase subunit PurQ [Synergistetes bacterium]|uniref:Phosphoribosylformylglycinamidine synthase subunit PurQ n=1 Tax=Thermotoga petrophila TaxID=93929 RepID=A0A101ENX6_9THEM|nr:MAG: Phosphoribosylformylglycinamidine synthase 1 [Thermotoga petrophila]MBC7331568.1 phosphoribosylformylglycinamidine synthase subunit PurQ [Synergistota bacterium]